MLFVLLVTYFVCLFVCLFLHKLASNMPGKNRAPWHHKGGWAIFLFEVCTGVKEKLTITHHKQMAPLAIKMITPYKWAAKQWSICLSLEV